jgi:hypothetical protein
MILKTNNLHIYFWFLCAISAILIFLCAYFRYASVNLSYEIETEIRLTKKIDLAYQNFQESYIAKLESLLADGSKSLDLYASSEILFIERYQEVAKAGL